MADRMRHYSSNVSGNRVHMFVLSPKVGPEQMLRPLGYNVTDQLIADLTDPRNKPLGDGESSLVKNASIMNFAGKQESVLSAVLPKSNGILLDTCYMDEKYKFMLVIDIDPNRGSISGKMPRVRQMVTGYFMDEPFIRGTIDSSRPIENPRAELEFVHTTQINLSSVHGNTRHARITAPIDDDLVPAGTASLATEGLYTMMPQDVRAGANYIETGEGPPELVTAYSDCHIDGTTDENAVIASKMNTPKQHFNHLLDTFDTGLNNEDLDNEWDDHLSSHSNPFAGDSIDKFAMQVDNNLMTSRTIHTTVGLDTSRSITLGELYRMYSDMVVIPWEEEIDEGKIFDARPQSLQTRSNTMSSMVASTVASMAASCSLASVGFSYRSWNHDVTSVLASGHWEWNGQQIKSLVPLTESELNTALSSFKLAMESQLFPILKTFGGEFTLFVTYISDSVTVIELQFEDYEKEYGYYVADNTLGGMSSALVGRIDDVTYNYKNITSLMNGIHGRKYGAYHVDDDIGGDWRDDMVHGQHVELYDDQELDLSSPGPAPMAPLNQPVPPRTRQRNNPPNTARTIKRGITG